MVKVLLFFKLCLKTIFLEDYFHHNAEFVARLDADFLSRRRLLSVVCSTSVHVRRHSLSFCKLHIFCTSVPMALCLLDSS